MTHILLCKQCGDIVTDDSHFDQCSDDCMLYESKNELFADQAIIEYLRMGL